MSVTATVPGPGQRLLVLRLLGLIVGGLLLGTAGAFVQADRAVVAGTAVPWGVVLVLVTLVLAVRGGAWLVRTRWGGAAVGLGWLAATLLFAASSPSGDIAIIDGGRQLAYLALGVLLASLAAMVPLVDR